MDIRPGNVSSPPRRAGVGQRLLGLRHNSAISRLAECFRIKRHARNLCHWLISRRGTYVADIGGCSVCFAADRTPDVRLLESFNGEGELIDRLASVLREGDVLYDIGAYIGSTTLSVMAKRNDIEWQALACEPDPENFRRLMYNISINAQESRVVAARVALGREPSHGQRVIVNPADPSTSVVKLSDAREDSEASVEVVTVTDLAHRSGQMPTVVKVDVEGDEWDVLVGMEDLLTNHQVRELFVEIHGGAVERDRIEEWLYRQCYSLLWSHARRSEFHQHYRASSGS